MAIIGALCDGVVERRGSHFREHPDTDRGHYRPARKPAFHATMLEVPTMNHAQLLT
jgi:hypothetical protein